MRYHIIPYNPKLKEFARQLRNNMTPGEISLWKYVKGKQIMGYDFDRQRPIDEFIVDFYCKQLMLAIEIDGSSHDSEEAQKRDRERQSRLESLGVRFLRFTEQDAKYHVEGVLEVIQGWILQNGYNPIPLKGRGGNRPPAPL
ncbi:endonuclease domain-containing protein [Lyngbya sp. CCAP 1446/10]|uniref:endonuclease domain-containing protein n=1 Tax=Lyngbya sp. CCAP 1446/10 TaxID=439293 RepID=UPI002237D44F|nr:endonuclease domain-containing protein [Lyngbya sp. CCAP 1446/10]MCW6051411.1 endonuclease domain-containing protein [Lyngbya sp. CCAP 1446/10]